MGYGYYRIVFIFSAHSVPILDLYSLFFAVQVAIGLI